MCHRNSNFPPCRGLSLREEKRHFSLVGLFLNFTCLFSPTAFSSSGSVGGGDEVGERLALQSIISPVSLTGTVLF